MFGSDISLAVQTMFFVLSKIIGGKRLCVQRHALIRLVDLSEENLNGGAVKYDMMDVEEKVSSFWCRDNKKTAQTVVMQIKGRNKVIRLKGVRVNMLNLYCVETMIFKDLSFFINAK